MQIISSDFQRSETNGHIIDKQTETGLYPVVSIFLLEPQHRLTFSCPDSLFLAGMIRKLCKVDPLLCPFCGGQMLFIFFIEEPKTIDRIIGHLELTFEAEQPPPPHFVQQELLMAGEESGEYF